MRTSASVACPILTIHGDRDSVGGGPFVRSRSQRRPALFCGAYSSEPFLAARKRVTAWCGTSGNSTRSATTQPRSCASAVSEQIQPSSDGGADGERLGGTFRRGLARHGPEPRAQSTSKTPFSESAAIHWLLPHETPKPYHHPGERPGWSPSDAEGHRVYR